MDPAAAEQVRGFDRERESLSARMDAYEQKRAELEPRLSAVRAAATGGA